MDKKFSFSDQPTKVKIIYGVVIAVLCISAIVVGIVSVASRKEDTPPITDEKPPVTDETPPPVEDTTPPEPEKPKATSFVAPLVGTVAKSHSLEMPVFSATLNEWRVHTGIDIAAEADSPVYAGADGTVTKIFYDNYYGKSVEVTHSDGIVSVYSNLNGDTISVREGDKVKTGAKIGTIGDTSMTELADEPHLHFSVKVNGQAVNPLDYITEESKSASLGIK